MGLSKARHLWPVSKMNLKERRTLVAHSVPGLTGIGIPRLSLKLGREQNRPRCLRGSNLLKAAYTPIF